MLWDAVLSWCLPSASCHCMWLIRPCFCNANRLRVHVCRKRQQIKIFPFYCHRWHLSISFSASSPVCVCVSVCFVGRHLSQLHCCQSETRNFPFCFFLSGRWLTALCRATYSTTGGLLSCLRVFCQRVNYHSQVAGQSVMELGCCIAETTTTTKKTDSEDNSFSIHLDCDFFIFVFLWQYKMSRLWNSG